MIFGAVTIRVCVKTPGMDLSMSAKVLTPTMKAGVEVLPE